MFGNKRLLIWLVFLIFGLLCIVSVAVGQSGSSRTAVIPIRGTIDSGTVTYVSYALDEIEREGIEKVILEFDTPGGYISAAEEVRRRFDQYDGTLYAFVSPNAISAGAYLALAADGIYMVPGSTIGAAEPRLLGMGEVDEKTISFWEKELSAMAERRGRDPEIAAAMVRKDLEIEGLVEQGVLLTLTAEEALSYGYCEAIVSNRAELLEAIESSDVSILEYEPRIADRLVGFTTNPVVGTILLMLGIGGLILEVVTAGFGAAGIISIAAFALYFGGNIAAGVAEYWVLLLFLIGIALMLVEAFMPGFGIFGVSGLIATVISIVLAAVSIQTGMVMLLISITLAGLFSFFAFRFFARRGALRYLILSEEERADLGYVAPPNLRSLTGLDGVVITALRPSGTAEIGGRRVDVVSEGSYVPVGERVTVDRVEGVRVIVRKLKDE